MKSHHPPRSLRVLAGTEQALTLLELVVVLAIMTILTALVTLAVRGIPDVARQRARATEYEIVLRAMDAYIAKDISTDPTATLSERAEADAAQISPGDGDAEFAKYLRSTTKYAYWWQVHGGGALTVTLHQVE
ncbi:MAG: prepilin-type N-terminal cleavage/methylation domain-containing protein [Chloroflexi bacterium]|nr:prepilin-type N-terminal cleavage/methylation domain-containing protein [Chloroflexota bacterium]